MASRFWLRMAGLFAWAVVALPTFPTFGVMTRSALAGWVVAWLAFGIAFWLAASGDHDRRRDTPLLVVQSVAAMVCMQLRPNAFGIVLLVVICGQLAHVLSVRWALVWVAVQTALAGVILMFQFPPRIVAPTIGAYLAFQAFAFFTGHLSHSEACARSELAVANAELRATADLLDASGRLNERLRIARDLHDLLGHHLTALTVNLEVASHLTEGKPRDHVEQARAIAKLLLADVRAVVSDLRDDQYIDLRAVLDRLVSPIPAPRIELRVADDVGVSDPALAQTLVRAVQEIVTNAVRHSGASTLTIDVRAHDGHVQLVAHDDGRGAEAVHIGNGLRGMRERAEAAGGTVDVTTAAGRGFRVAMALPNGDAV